MRLSSAAAASSAMVDIVWVGERRKASASLIKRSRPPRHVRFGLLLDSAITKTCSFETMSTFRSTSKGKERASFTASTLILVSLSKSCAPCEAIIQLKYKIYLQPIVSLANVSQLASDLLVHSLQMQLVGRLTSKYHIPVVSPRDYVEGQDPPAGLSTPVEGRPADLPY